MLKNVLHMDCLCIMHLIFNNNANTFKFLIMQVYFFYFCM